MKVSLRLIVLLSFVSAWTGVVLADEQKPIALSPPRLDQGKPLMQALNARKSQRAFGSEALPSQVLSDLLWAAFGVNRTESGGRTAPSAVNWQEIDIYVAMPTGLYVYQAKPHELKPVLSNDIRKEAGLQPFVKDAPLVLIFVADFARMGKASEEDKRFYSAVDTGYISQNIYLFCASEGLATVVLGMVDKAALAKTMQLRPDQRILLTQPVGFPKKP